MTTTKKTRGQRRQERIDELVTKYNNPNDCGAFGKRAETMNRFNINERTKLNRVQPMGKDDITIYQVNETLRRTRQVIENKTGAGTLDYSDYTEQKNAGADAQDFAQDLLLNVDYIIYTPEPCDLEDLHHESWVFTRKQFIDFLTNYRTKTGKPAKMLKFGKKSGKQNIYIQNMSSKPRQNYLWNTLADLPTLAEWIKQYR